LDPSGAQRVALSLSGEYFAAAAANKIYFYHYTGGSSFASPVGQSFATEDGSSFTDIAYDSSGSLLVAIAGPRVYGFGRASNVPVWTFDATAAAAGALDLPLKRLVVSDRAERILVAGPALNMTVPRAVVLNVTAEDRVTTLRAGGTPVPIPITIRNRGNADGVVNLTATQALSRGSSWPVRFQLEQVTVPVGGEKTV